MFTKEQVPKAIKEIDENLALLNGSRQAHLALVQDVKIVQSVCMDYFEVMNNVRTDKPIEHTPTCNKDS